MRLSQGLFFSFVAACLLAGCGSAKKDETAATSSTEEPEKEKKKDLPKIPGQEDDQPAASMETVIKHVAERPKDAYEQDDKVAVGTLKGMAFIKGKVEAPVRPVDLQGPEGLEKPAEGELKYYQNIKPQHYQWMTREDRTGRMGVFGVVLMLKDIKKGRRPPMNRPSLVVNQARIEYASGIHRGQTGDNYSSANMHFAFQHELAAFGCGDLYPCHLVMKKDGSDKVFFEGAVEAYASKDPKYKNMRFNEVDWMPAPQMVQSPPMRDLGLYRIHCARHKWQKAFIWVVNNPYVCVNTPHERGKFQMDAVPVGTWKVEVWHQDLEPLEKVIEVEIKPDETTEIPIEFKPPAGT